MVMSDFDIVKSYCQSKNKRKQISVLADLNGTSRRSVIDILECFGIEAPAKAHRYQDAVYRTPAERKRRVKIDWPLAVEMHTAGKGIKEIAAHFDCTETAIRQGIKREAAKLNATIGKLRG